MQRGTPIIRWAGSKRSSIGELLKFVDVDVKRYVEPFCGSAAMYFHLQTNKAVLADINHHLINFYQVLQRRPGHLYDCAVRLPRTKTTYYKARDEFNHTASLFRRACLFYYLNKNCFNGLFRTAKNGNFNVPFSKARVGDYPPREDFVAAAKTLKAATFLCADFEAVLLKHCRVGDLVYLDPPYSDAKRYPFREYFPGCFSVSDIDRLLSTLEVLDDRGVQFILTFSDRLAVSFAKRGWNVYRVRTRRNIAGFADARKYVDDLIVTNRKVAA